MSRAQNLSPAELYMKEAIRQAKKAAAIGEVPIGCVIEYEGKIIGRGYNRRMVDHTVLAHAEIIAMRKACKKMGDWRLEGCTMYVTLEPCPMCAGAIVQARIPKVVIGSMNPKAGCAGSVLDLLHEEGFNHQVETQIGVLGEECSVMLSEFFKALRAKKKKKADLENQTQDTQQTDGRQPLMRPLSDTAGTPSDQPKS
ncbi:MAG: tRNA adenosine(34) deaminase TadA [Eubacteriales bacterium]|nr:tRNA adenosine(34) deaminase TadA [Eubacteriales bacterium]